MLEKHRHNCVKRENCAAIAIYSMHYKLLKFLIKKVQYKY